MAAESAITTIAHVIQLAVAPVFPLSGVGALLAVHWPGTPFALRRRDIRARC